MPAILFNSGGLPQQAVSVTSNQFPTQSWKNAPIDWVRDHTNKMVLDILEQIPIVGNHKRVLVDVKVQNLVPEKCSCIPGWHCDSLQDPTHKSRPEVHHLITFGGAPTEFIAEPLILQWQDGYSLANLQKQIPDGVKIMTTTPGVLTTYDRFTFHRGVFAVKPLTRLLIRVTETDVVLPSTKAFIPA